MRSFGFDNDMYRKMQSEHILERIGKFGGKLYLEFGGKLFDDFHASRVLPGFEPDSKVRMLRELRDSAEIVIVINAGDIENNKVRGDLGITYDIDVLRLIDAFRSIDMFVGSVVIAQFSGQPSAKIFKDKLELLGVPVFLHYPIEGYPSNVEYIVSEEGFGRNEYIKTERPLVVVTAPGPGSGKMATCLSQLYHEHERGVSAGYAKFETFPIWNLPLMHPVNLAYEAATIDLQDINMIDPYHLEAYGETAVNYNRDIEVFPVLAATFEKIYGENPYKSPTDMGVNMAGKCIINDDFCSDASKREILRRYYQTLVQKKQGKISAESVQKMEILLNRTKLTPQNRKVAVAAEEVALNSGLPGAAIELRDGRIITGKTSSLLGCSAAALLNALKAVAKIDDSADLIAPEIVKPIGELKTRHLKNRNPRLHLDEVLIALSISAVTNRDAKKAMEKLSALEGTEAHTTVILSQVDDNVFKKLGINHTSDPKYQFPTLYHK